MTISTTGTAALNERVAALCGWTVRPGRTRDDEPITELVRPDGRAISWDYAYDVPMSAFHSMPNYAGSLDLMAQAESTLTESERGAFACALMRITLYDGLFAAYFATAKNRAEAFLIAKEYEPLELNAQRAGLSEEV